MQTETFETTDFHLAAYLRCRGWSLRDLRREGRRTVFMFADRPDRQTVIMGFFNDDPVPARKFAEAIRDTKALIHNT